MVPWQQFSVTLLFMYPHLMLALWTMVLPVAFLSLASPQQKQRGMLRKWQAREGDKGSGEIQSNILTSRFIRAAPHNYNASDKNIGPRSPAISTDGPTCQWQHAKKVTPRNCISAALLKTNDRRRTQVTIQWVEEEKNSADEMCCGCQSVRMEIQRWRRYFGNTMETDAS